jgi:hypothetical protein
MTDPTVVNRNDPREAICALPERFSAIRLSHGEPFACFFPVGCGDPIQSWERLFRAPGDLARASGGFRTVCAFRLAIFEGFSSDDDVESVSTMALSIICCCVVSCRRHQACPVGTYTYPSSTL